MGSMSAEVSSFSKRAAAELSRCFNGISTSVSSSSSRTSIQSGNKQPQQHNPTTVVPATSCNVQQNATNNQDNQKNNNHKIPSNNIATATIPIGTTTTSTRQTSNKQNRNPTNNNQNTEESTLSESSSSTTNTNSAYGFSARSGAVFGGAFRVFKNSEKLLSPLKSSKQPCTSGINSIDVASSTTMTSVSESNTITKYMSLGGNQASSMSTSVPMTPSKQKRPSRNGPPPKAPPKTTRARRKNYLLNLPKKPTISEDLFLDEDFLGRSFFKHFNPIEYCFLSQICKTWYKILYSNPEYWKQLSYTIHYDQLRQLGKESVQQQQQKQKPELSEKDDELSTITMRAKSAENDKLSTIITSTVDIINESAIDDHLIDKLPQQRQLWTKTCSTSDRPTVLASLNSDSFDVVDELYHRKRIYFSIRLRGFQTIHLQAPNDDDLFEFVAELSSSSTNNGNKEFIAPLNHIIIKNGTITDNGLEVLLTKFTSTLNSFELIGCNELTNSGLWSGLVPNLVLLTIQDCINISDDTVATLCQLLTSLNKFQFQAYHVTDIAMSYFSTSMIRHTLRVLTLQHCWEITNQGVANVAHSLPNLQSLSLSGCSKITDDAIEVVAEQLRNLQSLDLSWCPRISDAALEYIACDLADSLQTLVLDRCLHITDIGLGYLATMANLEHLSVRWCPQIRDFGIQALTSLRSLRTLSIAGCTHVTITGLSFITRMRQLEEIELTNCPAANRELVQYLSDSLSGTCSIII